MNEISGKIDKLKELSYRTGKMQKPFAMSEDKWDKYKDIDLYFIKGSTFNFKGKEISGLAGIKKRVIFVGENSGEHVLYHELSHIIINDYIEAISDNHILLENSYIKEVKRVVNTSYGKNKHYSKMIEFLAQAHANYLLYPERFKVYCPSMYSLFVKVGLVDDEVKEIDKFSILNMMIRSITNINADRVITALDSVGRINLCTKLVFGKDFKSCLYRIDMDLMDKEIRL